jgi:hypothetical protein
MLKSYKGTVRSELPGGLGNQVFAFAAGLVVSRSRQSKLILDCGSIDYSHAGPGVDIRDLLSLEEYEFRRFADLPPTLRRLRDSLLFRLPVLNVFYKLFFGIVNENEIDEGQSVIDFLRSHCECNSHRRLHLKGYFQDLSVVAEVKYLLTRKIQENYSPNGIRLLSSITKIEVLGIHIRGGDFLNPNWKLHVGNLSKSFYSGAISEVEERGFRFDEVWVFTNDSQYARTLLEDIDIDFRFIDDSEIKSPSENFNLMRHCGALITSNSSYSYLAAFLAKNSKLIIIPKSFSKSGHQINGVPKHWVELDPLWQ